MEVMKKLHEGNIDKELRFNVVISFEPDRLSELDFSLMKNKRATEVIQVKDKIAVTGFLQELSRNAEKWGVKVVNCWIGGEFDALNSLLKSALKSKTVQFFMLHEVDESELEVPDGYNREADPTSCYHALEQTPSNPDENAVCLSISKTQPIQKMIRSNK